MYGYFHDEASLYMILEYAPGGNLHNFMEKLPTKCFDEPM
jgi:serine/threonine protein kinase